jgi:hypothetical protein
MTKDEALNLALEALEKSLPRLAPYGEQDWLDSKAAITAIKQVLAKDALYKLAEESCTSGLRLDDWDKIGCVNHDCDKCKAVQEPVAWGNLANWCLDSDRVLITDKTEAEKYHRDVYDLTPLYTTPPAAPVQEPVAWMGTDIEGNPNKFRLNPFNGGVELYKKPQSVKVWDAEGYDALMQELELWKAAAKRKPLTLGQKQRLWSSVGDKPTLKDRVNAYGLAIEAAHGITDKGQP